MAEKLELEDDVISCREPLVGRYLTMLADCRKLTIDGIKTTREDLLYWRRSEFDSNISDLLYHIAFIEADWLFTDILRREIPAELTHQLSYKDRDNLGRLVHIGGEELEASLFRLTKVRNTLNDTYSVMDMGEFRSLRRSSRHEASPEWVLHHLLQHEAEHRGQINLLKRLGGENQPGRK